jgi:hypothetical protein
MEETEKIDYRHFLTNEIPKAITKINFDTKPLWGKMTAQHMIEHLIHSTIVSTILTHQPAKAPNAFQYKWKNEIIVGIEEMPRNIQNPLFQFGLPPYRFEKFEDSQKNLIEKIKVFYTLYDKTPSGVNFQSFFGDLDFEELQRFHYKHFKHHFTQFGAL